MARLSELAAATNLGGASNNMLTLSSMFMERRNSAPLTRGYGLRCFSSDAGEVGDDVRGAVHDEPRSLAGRGNGGLEAVRDAAGTDVR